MNASTDTLAKPANNTKPLWAAVGILSVAVLAMGGGLIYTQMRSNDTRVTVAAVAPAAPSATLAAAATAPAAATATVPAPVLEAAPNQDDLVVPPPKPPVVVTKPKPARPVHAAVPAHAGAVPAPAPVQAQAETPSAGVTVAAAGSPATGVPSVITDSGTVVSQPVVKPICANCGTIESVTPVEREGKAGGTGAVAGGVLGAVLGNQIGHGGGRTAATLLGALGGGFAGNAIEKHVKKETVYSVRVRMEDGSTRTVEQASLPVVGTRVTINNGVLHSGYAN